MDVLPKPTWIGEACIECEGNVSIERLPFRWCIGEDVGALFCIAGCGKISLLDFRVSDDGGALPVLLLDGAMAEQGLWLFCRMEEDRFHACMLSGSRHISLPLAAVKPKEIDDLFVEVIGIVLHRLEQVVTHLLSISTNKRILQYNSPVSVFSLRFSKILLS